MDDHLHQERFINFHKQRKSYWLHISIVILFGSFAVLTYAFQNQQKYNQLVTKVAIPKKNSPKINTIQNVNIPDNINNTSIYFQNEKAVFRKSPLDSQPQKVIDADVFGLSNEGSQIAYCKKATSNGNYYFGIVDTKTAKEKEMKLKKYDTIRAIEWSPEDKYILISYGSSQVESTLVYDLSRNVELGSFEHQGKIVWQNNTNIYLGKVEREIKNRSAQKIYGTSTATVDITKPGVATTIVRADLTSDYYPVSIKEDCIILKVDKVNSESDWSNAEKAVISEYACYNLQSHKLQNTDYENILDESLVRKIKSKLMLEENALATVDLFDPPFESNYKIAVVTKGTSAHSSDMFIFDIQNVASSLFLLGQGTEIYWRKM